MEAFTRFSTMTEQSGEGSRRAETVGGWTTRFGREPGLLALWQILVSLLSMFFASRWTSAHETSSLEPLCSLARMQGTNSLDPLAIHLAHGLESFVVSGHENKTAACQCCLC